MFKIAARRQLRHGQIRQVGNIHTLRGLFGRAKRIKDYGHDT